jgi:prefoldin subunit 5
MESQTNIQGIEKTQISKLYKELAEKNEYIKLLQSYVQELGAMNTNLIRKDRECNFCEKLTEKNKRIGVLESYVQELGAINANLGMTLSEYINPSCKVEKSKRILHIIK